MASILTEPRTVIWRRILDDHSDEYATYFRKPGGYRITSTVIGLEESAPFIVEYQVDCDESWRTIACTIVQRLKGERKELVVRAHGGHWLINGRADPALAACIDIDLGLSPSTNTLPINRERLNVGEKRDFEMAWVKFPDLTVSPLPQSYERLADRQYMYRSRGSDFKAVLEVDEFGIVKDYERLWKRRASGVGALSLR